MEGKKHCKWYNDEFCTNDKSPCVADYCPVVEYPELCKCREVAEDINVPNKRELSDEDIKKSLECCTELGRCMECPYFIKKIDCIPDQRHGKDVLDFVNRLQSDNAKQKEEIEQLTERLGYFQKSSDYHEGNQKELETKNAELQKQVDELKEERYYTEKDTAKEILTELYETKFKMLGDDFIYADNIKVFAKKYGVEVE